MKEHCATLAGVPSDGVELKIKDLYVCQITGQTCVAASFSREKGLEYKPSVAERCPLYEKNLEAKV